MQTTAEILICLGLIGAAEFAALAFASQRLATVTVLPTRLRRKMDSTLVRHARLVVAVSAIVAAIGLALR